MLELAHGGDASRNASDDGNAEERADHHTDDEETGLYFREGGHGSTSHGGGKRQVVTLSEEQIRQHPLVMSLMERLAVLEGARTAAMVATSGQQEIGLANQEAEIDEGGGGGQADEADVNKVCKNRVNLTAASITWEINVYTYCRHY